MRQEHVAPAEDPMVLVVLVKEKRMAAADALVTADEPVAVEENPVDERGEREREF